MLRSSRLFKLQVQRLEQYVQDLSLCSLSTTSDTTPTTEKDKSPPPPPPQQQPFVTEHLEAGEWDKHRKDPYFRPKPPKRAKFISAEDFANRPPVAFDGHFDSYADAMISLSWLDQKTCRQIYQDYCAHMVRSSSQPQSSSQDNTTTTTATSHEYVIRVLAQKFQLTTWRTAGVIQLQHVEEQMRRNSPELLCDEQAQYAEQIIQQNIRDAYKSERMELPSSFMEDPVGIHGQGEPDEVSTQWTRTEDIYNLENKLEQANLRDEQRARLLMDGHVYRLDVDETQTKVPIDGTARRLVKGYKTLQEQQKQQQHQDEQNNDIIPYPKTNTKGEQRPRWKFVAKVVNTRVLKQKHHERKQQQQQHSGGSHHHKNANTSTTSYTNNHPTNTLVEQNGTLRVATVEEGKQVSWKASRRQTQQTIYQGVQNAWLEHSLKGMQHVWGRAPPTPAAAAVAVAVVSDDVDDVDDVDVVVKEDDMNENDDLEENDDDDEEEEEEVGDESESEEEDEEATDEETEEEDEESSSSGSSSSGSSSDEDEEDEK